MYNQFFGFKEAPFKITPDTAAFFPGCDRGATLDALMFAIQNGEGFIKVVGEVGTGKTMLCRMLDVKLPKTVEVLYLDNPHLKPEDVIHVIAMELNLRLKDKDNRVYVMKRIQQALLTRHSKNKRVVVFVEEAQAIPLDTLEELRLLSNLETEKEKLLQIVLFGQPELDEHLAVNHIRQLRERITHSFELKPLHKTDVETYISHRLKSAGYDGESFFSDKAIHKITLASMGLMRRINLLCDKALLAAFAENSTTITSKHVDKAILDSDFAKNPTPTLSSKRVVTTVLIVTLLLFIAHKATGYGLT